MDISTEELKRKQFINILFELAKSQEILQDASARSTMYKNLEDLYYHSDLQKGFRHYYSDIFSVLTQIEENPQFGSIEILGQNIEIIRHGYQSKNSDASGNPIDISDSLRKLYDHVNLDIARINFSKAADRKAVGEDIREKVNNIEGKINSSKEKQKEIETKIDNSQREHIAVLGIFAAVVLAFTGGITFSTSVLENMHLVSTYRNVIVVLIIGLVVVDIIYGLFYFIKSMTKRKEEPPLRHLVLINIVFVVLMMFTVLAWHSGIIEKRNAEMTEYQEVAVVEQDGTYEVDASF